MLSFIPLMLLITLTLTFLYADQAYRLENNQNFAVASDFVRVHEWRIEEADRMNIIDGQVISTPGYPFVAFSRYYTEIHDAGAFRFVMTWPVNDDGMSENLSAGLADSLRKASGRTSYTGTFQPRENGNGGSIGPYRIIGTDRLPDPGTTVLLKVYDNVGGFDGESGGEGSDEVFGGASDSNSGESF